jgi:hypothetical protein
MDAHEIEAGVSLQQDVFTQSTRVELWRMISRLAETEQERVVLIDTFVYDLPLHTTLARHPDLFADIRAVRAAKHDLLARLQHHGILQRLRTA